MREQLQERRREIEQRSRKLREGSGGHWSLWVVALVFGLMFAYMLWKLRVP